MATRPQPSSVRETDVAELPHEGTEVARTSSHLLWSWSPWDKSSRAGPPRRSLQECAAQGFDDGLRTERVDGGKGRGGGHPGPRCTHRIALDRLPGPRLGWVPAERSCAMRASANSSSRPRHLTIADVCDELGVARSTFYDWRAKGAAPKCFKLPNGEIRVRRWTSTPGCSPLRMGWHDTVDLRRPRVDDPHRDGFTQQVLQGPMERRRPKTLQDAEDGQTG